MNTRIALRQSALRSLGITALTSLLLAIPRIAAAGDDPECWSSFDEFPADGETGVPLNPILISPSYSYIESQDADDWLDETYLASVSLRKADGTGDPIAVFVFVTFEEQGACFFAAYKPNSMLEPETAYVIEWDESWEVEFTTGTEGDYDEPVLTTNPDDPCKITYDSSERLVLMKSTSGSGIMHGIVLATPGGGIISGCDNPWIVFDASGNSVEVGGNADPNAGNGCDISSAGSIQNGTGRLLRSLF